MSKKRSTAKKRSSRQADNRTATGFPASGCWVNIFDPIIGELVGACGYDYAMIDMEHSPATIDQALNMIRAVQLGGAKALVRVPDKQPKWIGRLMDMGADGVMVPMVESAQEAAVLAAATVYAPDGTRGMAAPIVRASSFGVSTDHYLDHYRDNFILMVQIETAGAVEDADEIAAVEGVDCIFIGPFDLAGSLGYVADPDHKVTQSAMRKIYKAVKSAEKLISTLNTPKAGTKRLLGAGYDIVFSGSDVSLLRQAMQADALKSESLIQSRKA